MINPNQLGRRLGGFPASASQWMLVGLRGGGVTPPGLSDGDPVTTWTDSSGNGHAATQTGAARPIFKTAIVNGKPVVRYTSAGTQSMVLTPISSLSPWTIFAVFKPTGPVAVTLANAAATWPAGPLQNSDAKVYAANRGFVCNFPSTLAGFHIVTVSSASDAAPVAMGLDDTSQSPASGAVSSPNNFDSLGTLDVDIAEVILYNAALITADVQNIVKGLGTKYGITISVGTAVDPSTVTGLLAWWKADSLGS